MYRTVKLLTSLQPVTSDCDDISL